MGDDLIRAQDPGTSSDALGKLAFSKDPAVVEAVLANPNTPQWAKNRVGGRRDSDPDPSARTTAQVGAQTSGTDMTETNRLLDGIRHGQLATASYLRAGLMLLFTMMAFYGLTSLATGARADCAFSRCYDDPGLVWTVLAWGCLIAGVIATIVFLSQATAHLSKAKS